MSNIFPSLLETFKVTTILLNILVTLGIIICKMNYKKEHNTNFMANCSLSLSIAFTTYTICLIILAIHLLFNGQTLWGILIFIFSFIPYIIGKLSTYQKADLFVNIQIFALIINLFLLIFI